MKRPITIGNILTVGFFTYFIGTFFMYINEYSFSHFWNESNPEGVYIFSAGIGLIMMFGLFIVGMLYIITHLPISIVKLWNYPLIK